MRLSIKCTVEPFEFFDVSYVFCQSIVIIKIINDLVWVVIISDESYLFYDYFINFENRTSTVAVPYWRSLLMFFDCIKRICLSYHLFESFSIR